MSYWLLKSEPYTYSLDQLKMDKAQNWDGVRNYQARNFLKIMKINDLAFFYHSNSKPSGIVGIVRVSKECFPDPTQFDSKSEYFDPKATLENPRWFCVQVEFVKEFEKIITLEELKKNEALKGFSLISKGNRLSVMPVDEKYWDAIAFHF